MTAVLIWVQHLLGTGHTVRAAAIGRALAARGADVTMVLGAVPPSTLDLAGIATIQLTPVAASDATFSTLVTADGRPYAHVLPERHAQLAATVERVRPAAILTETFPFGRRPFAGELMPILEALPTPRPLVATSVRDVLVRKPMPKAEAMAERARALCDMILVHADPRFVTLGDSFAAADKVADLVHYTGFVHAPAPQAAAHGEGEGEAVVSCGGGAVGRSLVEAAIGAARRDGGLNWRILVPPGLAELMPGWRAEAPPNVALEPNRPDFRALLGRAALSVSQAGYNTALDVLSAGVRAIFVPFAAHDETEQTDRAEALAARGLAQVLAERDLTADRLAATVAAAMARPASERPAIDLDGADRSAALILEHARCAR